MKLLLKTMLLCALALPHAAYALDQSKEHNRDESIFEQAEIALEGFLSESKTVSLELEKKGELKIETDENTLSFNKDSLTGKLEITVTTNLLDHPHSLHVTPDALVLQQTAGGKTRDNKAAPKDREMISYVATLDGKENMASNKLGKVEQIKKDFSPTNDETKFHLNIQLNETDFRKAAAGTFSGKVVVNVTSQT